MSFMKKLLFIAQMFIYFFGQIIHTHISNLVTDIWVPLLFNATPHKFSF